MEQKNADELKARSRAAFDAQAETYDAGMQGDHARGLYRIVAGFFESVALDLETSRPLDAARLRAASTHWLRHSFAVEALTKMNVNIVQAAMGHASVSTTGRYLAPEEEEMSDALARMSRF